jgi:TPR repeat protein
MSSPTQDGSQNEFDAASGLYFSGDYVAAFAPLVRLSDTHPMAAHFVGVIEQMGLGDREANNGSAAAWYVKAANGGIGVAAFNLGILHEAGLLDGGNAASARPFYEQAWELGHEPALEKLSALYGATGQGTSASLRQPDYHAKRRNLWDRIVGRR